MCCAGPTRIAILFMDTRTFRATAGLAKLKADIDQLLGVIADDTRKRIKR